jgi:ATP-dependent RNA helicase DeaD
MSFFAPTAGATEIAPSPSMTDPTDCTNLPPTFDVLPLSRELRQAIDDLGYTHPTPVQREVFEPASRGRDVVVQARTGTGKTAAFGMPIVDAVVQRSLGALQVLILCPTRELALQVHRELDTLGRYRGVKSVAVYGGAPMARQIEELAAGAQVVAGTPGRVLDHLRRGSLDPSSIKTFVLDESDEMLSMGFLPQINEILGYLPSHQTLLFSATLPPDIQRLAETKLKDPLFLTLSGDQIGALDIQHLVYLTRGDKLKDFIQVLEVENPESAIVFCNTRDETKRVAAALDRLGFTADWLNADLAQNEREKVMAATRGGDLRFLVCTDVAARGIDISHLTHVINYDLPESPESYVHRTGRTGRAGRTGTAISLIEPSDIGHLYMLRLTYKIFPIEKQLPTAGELKTRQELDVVEMFAEAFANRPIHPDDLSLARRLMTHEAAEAIVAGLLRDHLGARPDAAREATEARRTRTSSSSARRENESAAPRNPGARESLEQAPTRTVPSAGPRATGAPRDTTERTPPRPRPERGNGSREVEPPAIRSAGPRPTEEPVPTRGGASDGPERARRPSRESASLNRPSREPPPRRGGPSRQPSQRVYRDEDLEVGYSVGSADPAPVAEAPETSEPSSAARGGEWSELFVNIGRVDGAQPNDILRLLEQAGLARMGEAQVNLRRNHCFVRVAAEDFAAAEAALNGKVLGDKPLVAERSRGNRS